MIAFSSKNFQELTTQELYQILALRAEVFVVEQNCPYQDVDGKDPKSIHVLGYLDNQLIAYSRLLEQGISYKDYASIGRVVTSPSVNDILNRLILFGSADTLGFKVTRSRSIVLMSNPCSTSDLISPINPVLIGSHVIQKSNFPCDPCLRVMFRSNTVP